MLNWYMQEYLQQARQQALMREVEQQRRVRLALVSHQSYTKRGPHTLGRALIWLGGRLVTWGSRLQSHGSNSAPSATFIAHFQSPALAPWRDGYLSNGASHTRHRFHRN